MNRLLLPICAALVALSPTISQAELSALDQQARARRMGEKAQRFEIWTDDDGNVTGLIFINHQALTKSVGEKPGINDADLLELVQFPKLTALNIEAQPVGDAGLRTLEKIPQLRQAGFHYMAKAEGANASPDFITVVDGMRDLEILEIKHNFRMKAINVDRLEGPFPKVWRLVLDTPLTPKQTIHMARLCPNVTDLQLHRTELSPEQLAEIGALLPKLEVLWLKVKGGLRSGHLSAMTGFKQLRIFSPQSFQKQITYEEGWNALMVLPRLERLEIFGDPGAGNVAAIEQLQTSRPSLVVDSRLTRSRNYDGL